MTFRNDATFYIPSYYAVLQHTNQKRSLKSQSVVLLATEIKVTCTMNCICCLLRMREWEAALEQSTHLTNDALSKAKLNSSALELLRFMYFKSYAKIMTIAESSRPSVDNLQDFDIERSRKANEVIMELQDMQKVLVQHENTELSNSAGWQGALNDFQELVDLFHSHRLNGSQGPAPATGSDSFVMETGPQFSSSSSSSYSSSSNNPAQALGEVDSAKVEVGQQLLREGKYKEALQWHSAAISSHNPDPAMRPALCGLLKGRARASAGLGEQKQVYYNCNAFR